MIAACASHLVTLQTRRYCNRIDMPEPDNNAHASPAVCTVCCDFRVLTVKTVCPEFPKPAVAVCLNGKNDGRSWKSGRRTKRAPDTLSCTSMTVSRFDRVPFLYVRHNRLGMPFYRYTRRRVRISVVHFTRHAHARLCNANCQYTPSARLTGVLFTRERQNINDQCPPERLFA